MNDYYIKIKKGDAQIEFSTTDNAEFGRRLGELMELAGALDRGEELSVDRVLPNLDKKSKSTTEFDKLLEKNLDNPPEQKSPNFGVDTRFENIYQLKKINGLVNSLIFTAAYFVLYENTKSFTLKDINRKLFPVAKIAVGHNEINISLAQGLLNVLPSDTEDDALTKYALTKMGERYYNALIK